MKVTRLLYIMKTKLLIFVTLLTVNFTIAQNFQTVEEVNEACATLGFSSNEDAEIAVDRIMDVIGLPKNFTLQECPNINNAIAKNITNNAGLVVRYILYDNEFFQRMDSQASTDWAAISILAHEIGHHLSGHSLNNEGSNHQYELEADYFSGMILARMGASLREAQSAIQQLRYAKATSTHPAKADRLIEIEKGWNKGKGKTNVNPTNNNEDDDVNAIVEYYLENANKGDAYAQSYLGYLYDTGTEIPRDYSKAMYWYKKAAAQDDTYAIYNIGTMYYHGKGVAIDYYESATWYYKSATLGDLKSQYFLGIMLYEGTEGIAKDATGGIFWMKKAAEQGDTDSLDYLGYVYEFGEEVPKDYYLALKYYKEAARFGSAYSQYRLGNMYYKGLGVTSDYYEAYTWYYKAALQGNEDGEAFIGYMYETGNGISKNYGQAVNWYRKAARQGNEYSQDKLRGFGESW